MLSVATAHKKKTGRVLQEDVIARELKDGSRIIAENDEWLAYVPYAARYPFEIHVSPKTSVANLVELTEVACEKFAPIAREVLKRLDAVFEIKMAYIAAWHQAPVHSGSEFLKLNWQITSVRRAPGKLKYLAGSESAYGSFMMDLSPEQSAQLLRDVKI